MAGEGDPENQMTLFVWPGEWGIPSICHNCLSVMAYCKFSSVPMSVVNLRNPWKSPTGDLPSLKDRDRSFASISDIFNHLRKENWGTDHDLSAVQSADILAFLALLQDKLDPALSQLWWSDAKTYVELTRPLYGKVLPFPLSLFLPAQKHRQNVNNLAARQPQVFSDSEWENKIYKDAKECMNILSAKLGDQDYFFGNMPSSLDAIVFGYLAPLLKAPFPNPVLQSHLKGCMNLVHLVDKITEKFFPLSDEEMATKQQQEEASRQKLTDLTEFPNKRRNMVFAGIIAVTAMASYALLSGLIQVEVVNSEDSEESGPDESKPREPVAPNFNQFDKLFDNQDSDEHQGGQENGDDEQ